MPVEIVKGDIWASPADVRVNTVNTKGIMGAGIAKEFKSRYPKMFPDYVRACRADEIMPGGLHVWEGDGETIINLATKDHWRDPSRYGWIEVGLNNLRKWLETQPGAGKTLKVALPALGCSNGGLSFSLVSSMVSDALGQSPHEIKLFHPI